jgi:8-oxo-dGTP pyrophosphatase MutT (NUDIX family)
VREGFTAAATAVLVDRQARPLRVYLVRRHPKSGFMGGNYVFPGGVVDPLDREALSLRSLSDLEPALLFRRLGGDLCWEEALAYGVAVLRETFEEAGVLLGGCSRDSGLRELLELRRAAPLPADWLLREAPGRGLRLALSTLSPWARWITPAGMKRRFDTRFFVAPAPQGQLCSPDGREVVEGLWATPREALEANLRGEIPLSPPTLVTLQELLSYEQPEDLLAEAGRRTWGEPLQPRYLEIGGGAVILEPWDPEHGKAELGFDPERLLAAVLPAGEPFSRLWYDGRIWRPIRVF